MAACARGGIWKRLIGMICAVIAAGAAAAAPLDGEVARLISDGAASRAVWGFHAVDVESGRVLATLNAEKLFVPASTRKLVSTAMAAKYLGASKVLETRIAAAEKPSAGRVRGDLVVKAAGDPSWTPGLRGGRPGAAVLREAAQQLRSAGVVAVDGDLVIDASRFREPAPMPQGWEWADFQTSDGAIPSVFGIDRNVASVLVEPGRPGEAVRIAFESRAAPFELENMAKTGARDSAPTFQLSRGLDGLRLVATGSLAANAAAGRRAMPVGRPIEFAAGELAAILKEEGIALRGRVRVSLSPVAANEVFATIRSVPVGEIVAAANRESDNHLAESLYLLAGAELFGRGSYEASLEAERRLWKECGVEAAAWGAADGSGLSRRNLVTPEALVKLLVVMRGDDAFVASLPVSGRSGTLRYRLAENGMADRIRAKTGTLTGVAALAGYIRTNSGRTVAFCAMANNFTSSPAPIRADIDRLIERLAAGAN